MQKLLDVLCIVGGFIALAVTLWQFIIWIRSPGTEGNTTHLWYAVAAFVVTGVCALGFFVRHVNRKRKFTSRSKQPVV